MPEHPWDRVAVSAIACGAALRIAWIVFLHPPVGFVYSDMRGYVQRAEHLAVGDPLRPVDAFYPPGTHLLLSIPIKIYGPDAGLWGAAILWCVLSIAAVWLSWRLARHLLTPAAAGLTAIFVALWPLFITFGGYFTSETPALTFLLASLWSGVNALRRGGRAAAILAMASGALGAVAAAIRPQLLLNVFIMATLILIFCSRKVLLTAAFGIGLTTILAMVVIHNSAAAGQPTGLATNAGLNFWFGHCEARQVITFDGRGAETAHFTHPVPNQLGRGADFVFRGIDVSDDAFFFRQGWDCIEKDGAHHAFRLVRNILDMTATTVPFPQSDEPGWMRNTVQATNLMYSVLVPWIVIESLFLIARRRRSANAFGAAFFLLNLACVACIALVILGDPRVRSVYDVFGLALLAALLADRFGGEPGTNGQDP